MSIRRVSILGATGSVGLSTAAVLEERIAAGDAIEVEAVTAGANIEALVDVVRRLRPRFVAVAHDSAADAARAALTGMQVEIGVGSAAVVEAAQRPADWVMAAIVGAAGLEPTMAAVRQGATVALANKESLVCAGALITQAAAAHGARLIPVDSEHSAIFQVWEEAAWVDRITLTASGGPFRTWGVDAMAAATPEQACAHPTWRMGAKISVDSATLMNKGLELVEATHLFAVPEGRIDIVIHPQSIIHSLVHYVDGSVLAQLSEPDMRVPIAYALSYPARAPLTARPLDLVRLQSLTFEAPDETRFPALRVVRAAARAGSGATAALNAANEEAVEAFLKGRLGFAGIAAVTEAAVEAVATGSLASIAKSPSSLHEVALLDREARRCAALAIGRAAA